MPKKSVSNKPLKVTLIKSPIGYTKSQKATVRALGLHRINQTVEQVDSPAVRGMLNKIRHLIKVQE